MQAGSGRAALGVGGGGVHGDHHSSSRSPAQQLPPKHELEVGVKGRSSSSGCCCCCHNGNTACCTKVAPQLSGEAGSAGKSLQDHHANCLIPFCRFPREQQLCRAGFLLWGIPTSDCGGLHRLNWRCVERPAAPAPFAVARVRALRARAARCDRVSRTAALRAWDGWRTHLYITNSQNEPVRNGSHLL